MKYVAAIFAFLFIWSAYLQLNDPDPVWWATIYLVVTYIAVQAFRGKFNQELLITISVLYAALALNSWLQMTAWEGFTSPGQGMAMKTPN